MIVLSILCVIIVLRLKSMIFGVYGLIIKMGFELEVLVVIVLIGGYGSYDISVAWKFFVDMFFKDLVMWSVMVFMCVKNGEYMEVIELFRKMLYEGIEFNFVSIMSILLVCVKFDVF